MLITLFEASGSRHLDIVLQLILNRINHTPYRRQLKYGNPSETAAGRLQRVLYYHKEAAAEPGSICPHQSRLVGDHLSLVILIENLLISFVDWYLATTLEKMIVTWRSDISSQWIERNVFKTLDLGHGGLVSLNGLHWRGDAGCLESLNFQVTRGWTR